MEQTMTQGTAHFHLRKTGEDPEIFYVRIPHIYSLMRSDWPLELWNWLSPFLMDGFCTKDFEKSGISSDIGTVYDPTVDNWLKRADACGWWEKYWPLSLFTGYRKEVYGKALLKRALQEYGMWNTAKKVGEKEVWKNLKEYGTETRSAANGTGEKETWKNLKEYETTAWNVTVLGYESFGLKLLERSKVNINSLELIMEEAELLSKEVEDFSEKLEKEQGILVSCRQPKSDRTKRPFYGMTITGKSPQLVLDFSREAYLKPDPGVLDCLWLDMDGISSKKRYLRAGGNRVHYYSMKEEWKEFSGLKS